MHVQGVRYIKVSLLCCVNPVIWLGVFRVINLTGGIDRRRKVFKQAATLLLLSIDENLIATSASRTVSFIRPLLPP